MPSLSPAGVKLPRSNDGDEMYIGVIDLGIPGGLQLPWWPAVTDGHQVSGLRSRRGGPLLTDGQRPVISHG